ncbi:MAG: histidine phosphatase family protein [Flavobacteriaceae bacterium]|nr:histidine phosphatase family protein [Flavobacteriaceae bacterium]
MKKITCIRHAKSAWELDVSDFDRALNQRGVDDAHLVGKHLKNHLAELPDIMLSSPANRALQTAVIICRHINYPLDKLVLRQDLYTFNSIDLYTVIAQVPNEFHHLMFFSHNFGITDFVNKAGDKKVNNVPTCGVTQITFNTDSWKSLGAGKTVFKLFPKHLK